MVIMMTMFVMEEAGQYFVGKMLWKWFLNKVEPLFFDVIPQRGDRDLNMGYWVSRDLMVELCFPANEFLFFFETFFCNLMTYYDPSSLKKEKRN